MKTAAKTLLMQRLQDAARFAYVYYTTGTLDDPAKLDRLTRKFAIRYETTLSRSVRYHRRRSGEAATKLYILERPTTPRYWFVLMATEGLGRVHSYEQLRDLRRDRLTIDGYELVHDGRAWSWQMSRETLHYWRERIHTVAALPPSRRQIQQDSHGAFDADAEKILASLHAVPGFRLARRQVGRLIAYMRSEWQRLRPMVGVQPRWRTFLGYVRRLPNTLQVAPPVRQSREGERVSPVLSNVTGIESEEARIG